MAKIEKVSDERQLSFDIESLMKKSIRLLTADEIYEKIASLSIVDVKEDRRVERKPAGISARSLGEYFSIFANTSPDGGVLLIGVEDDGLISGCAKSDQKHLNELERAGDTFCPDARYECKTVRLNNSSGNEDSILAVRIYYRPDRVVETTDGHAWIRRGESKKKLTDEEKHDLRNIKGQLDLEREPVALSYPEDFKASLIAQFVANVRAARNLPETLQTDEILELRRLGKIVNGFFKPNLACALLFAKDPELVVPGCRIRFFRFDGTVEKTGEHYNAIKSEWIEGTVPEIILNCERIVDGQVREFSKLGKDNHFYSTPEYPKAAWYEAVVNACVHRSYALKNMNIFVKMFDDRLVIESPGGFPPYVTPDNIYDMHQPRNPHLMDAMFYLKFVLCAHEGTRRIRDYMQSSGLPAPVFQQKDIGGALVQVILKNDVEHRKLFVDTDAFTILGETLSKQLSEMERRIVNFIAENRTINVTQTSNLTNRRWQYCKKILTSLVDRGVLDYVHNSNVERDSFQYYVLKKKFSDKIKPPSTSADS
ncbi:ATP-binding protein [Hansschlegelia zhihuaiae]|uniref:Schlafen AlbA-2 domain-containing protein n=1 Tax=Hansschlegelia zhihuaiae TaxID=405005 RepID=A0A4Q0M3V1_9HYPH|nr:ATP-binding protein [Hansschlegelia zhihuaiae]RXF67554.1 hypothetical protein EK403_21215 [Hansschlegelia zhihuaiae]